MPVKQVPRNKFFLSAVVSVVVLCTISSVPAQNVTSDEPGDETVLHATVNSDQRIVLHGSGEEVAALDFKSELGLLVPIEPIDGVIEASPWDIALENSPTNVVIGTLGPAIKIDGSLTTKVGYSGGEAKSDLVAVWGNDSEEIFELPVLTLERVALSGFINSDRKIVLVGTGEEVVAYQFESNAGLLEPIPTGEDVAPFEHILANELTVVTVGNLGSAVVVDGELTTPVGYRGQNPEEELVAVWGAASASDPIRFIVTAFECGTIGLLDGDIDDDGLVGFSDFLILSRNFGGPGTLEQGDLNCSGEIDFADFLVLSENFGESVATIGTVPEPKNALPFAFVAFAVLLRSQQRRRPACP